MEHEHEQLAVLRRMLSDGRISDREFRDLARPLVTVREVEDEAAIEEIAEPPQPEATDEHAPLVPRPTLRKDLSANYVVGIVLAAMAMVVASSLNALPWLVTVPVTLLLATTLIRGWRLVTVIGAAAMASVVIVSFVLSSGASPQTVEPPTAAPAPGDPYPPIAGSLGVYMDQVSDLWNTVDTAPTITKGLTRYNETGQYDTFIYRFDSWGRVAGAYDPDNDALYALLVTGQLSNPATASLYLHLCYVVAPYSQDCIDAYHQEGLGGRPLADYVDVAHRTEWSLGEHTWRLEIEGNVLTIRVFGADAA